MSRAKARSPLTDRRYQAFVRRYRYNWPAACKHVFGQTPTWQQREVLEALQPHPKKRQKGKKIMVSVASGHGTGKSDLLAMVGLLFIMLYPDARVLLISNKIDQTMSGLGKYLHQRFDTAVKRFPWLSQYFETTHRGFRAKCARLSWMLTSKSFLAGNEEALAGEHAENLLWIADEASAISDKAFKILTGSMTQANNRLCMLSQPTRQSGYFYDSHHSLRYSESNPDGVFTSLTLSSEESPLVDDAWLAMKAIELGGRHTPDYRIKVLGLFADSCEGALLTRDECLRAQRHRVRVEKGWGWVGLADPGDGGDKSVLIIGRMSGRGVRRRFQPVKIFVTKIKALYFGNFIDMVAPASLYPGIRFAVDGGGVGSPVCDRLADLGRPVQKIMWGRPPFSDNDKRRFSNVRTQSVILLRDAILTGRISLPPGEDIVNQAVRMELEINNAGQYALISKKELKRRGFPSPDELDALAYSQIADYSALDAFDSREADEALQEEARALIHAALNPEENNTRAGV